MTNDDICLKLMDLYVRGRQIEFYSGTEQESTLAYEIQEKAKFGMLALVSGDSALAEDHIKEINKLESDYESSYRDI